MNRIFFYYIQLSEPRKGKLESLGQAFLKACRFQKDRVLCLYSLPILTLFHGLLNVPVHIVPRSGTQNIILNRKVCFSGVLSGRNLSCRFLPLSQTVPRTVWEIHLPRAHCVSVQSRKSVKISDALGVRAPFEKGAPKLFLTLSGGNFGKI